MRRLTQEEKNQWLAALRSGEYKQGMTYLKSKDEFGEECYCCLGVLVDTLGIADEIPAFEDGGYDQFVTDYGEGRFVLLSEKTQRCLAGMNDDDGKSFEQIADYIEREIECD